MLLRVWLITTVLALPRPWKKCRMSALRWTYWIKTHILTRSPGALLCIKMCPPWPITSWFSKYYIHLQSYPSWLKIFHCILTQPNFIFVNKDHYCHKSVPPLFPGPSLTSFSFIHREEKLGVGSYPVCGHTIVLYKIKIWILFCKHSSILVFLVPKSRVLPSDDKDIKVQMHKHTTDTINNIEEPACSAGDAGQEDPLEEEMATHSSILAWRIPWTEKPGRLQSIGLQRVSYDWELKHRMSTCMQHRELYLTYCGDLNKKEIRKGRDIWMRMVDPFCCAVEISTQLNKN